MIEKQQKVVLFNEAARKGIINSDLINIPNIYADLVGIRDIGVASYGSPLAPIYVAKAGADVKIDRMSKFITGLARDLQVSDLALTEIENSLNFLNLELWARMQILKNSANSLKKAALTERSKLEQRASWSFVESFTNTYLLDMNNTTAWLDTSEGIAFLPNVGEEKTILPTAIKIDSQTEPYLGGFLNSTPAMAFDGLEQTNWRCLFALAGTNASCTASFEETAISSVTLDPIGFGLEVTVEVYTTDWETIVKRVLYNKTSIIVNKTDVTKLRVTFAPATASLPKVVGFRSIQLYNTNSSQVATIWSKELVPNSSWTSFKFELDADTPEDCTILPYYRVLSTDVWKTFTPNSWQNILNTATTRLTLSLADLQSNGILYSLPLGTNPIPINDMEGYLEFGAGQLEVAAYQKDYAQDGDIPHLLRLEEFDSQSIKKAWCNPLRVSNSNSFIAQPYGTSYLTGSWQGASYSPVFERYGSFSNTYRELCIVPFFKSNSSLQAGYNYRIRYKVYAPKEVFIDSMKYLFLQGFKNPLLNSRNYRDTGKSYGSFSLYVNGNPVCSESNPATLFNDNTYESGANNGVGFFLKLEAGWNTVDILVSLVGPNSYLTDTSEVEQYLQVSLYPSLLDPVVQNDYGITAVLGTGNLTPVMEFDLVWDLPQSPTFWAWSSDRKSLLFNTAFSNSGDNTTGRTTIDGVLQGTAPNCNLVYNSIGSDPGTASIFIRLDLIQGDNSLTSPLVREYRVFVK